ncbi:MAG: PorP/SprF family type IX secretion system membrane protein [Bacteroidales bacterium]|nr:PorP/SprF family type IX secretion system membrane protein [Bacteroidales bacterium]
MNLKIHIHRITACLMPLFMWLTGLEGQDIHYSQFYSMPLYVNPAFTGNHECDFRAGLNYRQQAASFTVPFETYSAFGDTRIYPKFLKRRAWIGLGGHFYYDNAGDGGLQKTQGMFFGAFSQGFNSDNSLYGSLGIGLGLTNRSINYNKLIFDSQWDPIGLEFDPSLPNEESFSDRSLFYPDFNMGLSVHHLVNDSWMYELGASLSHITKPSESFFGENNRVEWKWIAHGGAQIIAADNILIKPEAFFVAHEGVSEMVFGGNAVFGRYGLRLHGGIWHRLNRDVIPVAGIEYNKLTLLFSYDINISKQRLASRYDGGFELSLVKRFCARRSTKREPCKFLEF